MEVTGKGALGAEKVKKREDNIQKANRTFRFFSILCVGAIIFCLLFPHGTFIFLTCTFFLCWLVSLCVKRGKGVVYIPFFVYPLVVGMLFCMAWMLLIIPIMEVIFCKHRPWEYTPEIQYYKTMDSELSYFPQKLPKGARNVEWIVVPTVWQAKGCLVLAFDADEEYIQQYLEDYPSRGVDIYEEFSKEYYDEDYRSFCEAMDIDAFDMVLNPLLPQQVELSLEEVKTAVNYQLKPYTAYGQRGYIVVEGSNRLIIYRDYER